MKAIIGRFAVIITLSLVFLLTSLVVSPESAFAWGTLSVPAGGIVHNHGGAGVPPVTDSFTCETWNTNGIKCHWLAGRPSDAPSNYENLNLYFNDSRGDPSQQLYYIQIVSDTSGNFTSGFPDIEFANNSVLAYKLATETNPAVGTGLTIINNTISDMYDERINFSYMAETGHGANSVDVTFYISPTPFVTEIPAKVYLDTTEMPQQSDWIARLPAYFSEMNFFLLPTNKRISWDGTVHVADVDPFNFSTENCLYDQETSLKIWFSSTVDGNKDGYSYGTDCDGIGTIVIDTNNIHSGAPYTIPDRASLVSYQSTPGGWADYWSVVIGLLHEFIHTRGGYAVETYWFDQVPDLTQYLPDLSIRRDDPGDLWWRGDVYGGWAHPEFRKDPMSGSDIMNTFDETRSYIALSTLSRNFVNFDNYIGQIHTNTFQDVTEENKMTHDLHLKVTQYNDAGVGTPVPGITIKAWYMGVNDGNFPRVSNPVGPGSAGVAGTYITDSNGEVDILWDFEPMAQSSNAIMLKSYYDAGGTQPYGRTQIVDIYNLQQKVFATGAPITEYTLAMGKVDAEGYNEEVNVPAVFASSPLSPVMGWIRESAFGSGVGGTKVSNGPVRVGDDSSKRGIRSVIQFDTSYIPDDAIITGATLNLTNDGTGLGDITGFGPTSDPDSMAVQAGLPCIGSCFLQSTDYEASLATLGYFYAGNNPEPTLPPGQYRLNSNLTRISKTGVTDLRLRFNKVTDIDGYSDYFSAYGASSAQPPTFTVGYRMP